MSLNDPPMKSRKFLAFLLSEITWKIILVVLLILEMQEGTLRPITGALAMAIVIVIGFMEALYIGGQAALDKYTNVALIAAKSGQSFNIKGMQVSGQAPPRFPPERDGNPRVG